MESIFFHTKRVLPRTIFSFVKWYRDIADNLNYSVRKSHTTFLTFSANHSVIGIMTFDLFILAIDQFYCLLRWEKEVHIWENISWARMHIKATFFLQSYKLLLGFWPIS